MRSMNAPALNVLITGASGGIGYELAKLFANDHHNLVLVARNGPRLEQVADELQRQFGITVRTCALDLTDPAAPQSLFAQLHADRRLCEMTLNTFTRRAARYGIGSSTRADRPDGKSAVVMNPERKVSNRMITVWKKTQIPVSVFVGKAR